MSNDLESTTLTGVVNRLNQSFAHSYGVGFVASYTGPSPMKVACLGGSSSSQQIHHHTAMPLEGDDSRMHEHGLFFRRRPHLSYLSCLVRERHMAQGNINYQLVTKLRRALLGKQCRNKKVGEA